MTDVEAAPYVDPRLSAQTLDGWWTRSTILAAVRDELPNMHGVVLDVGCGIQPYRSLLLAPPSRAERVIGVDIETERYGGHDIVWDGVVLPIADAAVDYVLATELLEHCPEPAAVLGEMFRVLRPGGRLLFTVPFLWPLHDMPYDEYRYTPFALDRLLTQAGFASVEIQALGGWDASLAQMIGLWVRRRPMGGRRRAVLSRMALPVVRALARRDKRPATFDRSVMLTGLSGTAVRPEVEPDGR